MSSNDSWEDREYDRILSSLSNSTKTSEDNKSQIAFSPTILSDLNSTKKHIKSRKLDNLKR
jgi:hypothetical protein